MNRAFYRVNSAKSPTGYERAHSLPYSSSVADPSHSPIERGQQHGLRKRVWKKFRKDGGGYGWGINKLKIKTRKETEIRWIQYSQGTMTRGLKFSERCLDG